MVMFGRRCDIANDGAGLKATARSALFQGLNRLRKKSEQKANVAKDGVAAAKAQLILLPLSARLKPCPCYKAPLVTFSAACKAELILLTLSARLKPCPCYKAPLVRFFRSL